jgi:hypothetical protein
MLAWTVCRWILFSTFRTPTLAVDRRISCGMPAWTGNRWTLLDVFASVAGRWVSLSRPFSMDGVADEAGAA